MIQGLISVLKQRQLHNPLFHPSDKISCKSLHLVSLDISVCGKRSACSAALREPRMLCAVLCRLKAGCCLRSLFTCWWAIHWENQDLVSGTRRIPSESRLVGALCLFFFLPWNISPLLSSTLLVAVLSATHVSYRNMIELLPLELHQLRRAVHKLITCQDLHA